MAINPKAFLGTGWDFPPAFDKTLRTTLMLEGEEDIRSSLYILVSTALGERVMRTGYGTDLDRQVFEPLDEGLKSYLKGMITDAIHLHEPRVTPNEVRLDTNPEQGQVIITVEYTVISTNTSSNVVFPYYRSEGKL
jgi:phage baseplate assembly protein W